jgi:hypothetical protein
VSWDKESAATPFGQLVFFAEFLEVSGLFDPKNGIFKKFWSKIGCSRELKPTGC